MKCEKNSGVVRVILISVVTIIVVLICLVFYIYNQSQITDIDQIEQKNIENNESESIIVDDKNNADKEEETRIINKGITEEFILSMSDEELIEIFYEDVNYFLNFSGIHTDNNIPIFSAVDKEEAVALIKAAYGENYFKSLEYIKENELFFSFDCIAKDDNYERINIWKEDIYHTNFGLTEEMPELFENRELKDKFNNISKEIIKQVYDTIYDDTGYNYSSKILYSIIEENDTDFIYTIYRIVGGNADKTVAEYFRFEKMFFLFDKTTGIEKMYEFETIREIDL